MNPSEVTDVADVADLPEVLRRVESAEGDRLATLVTVFENLQVVLASCDRAVSELERPGPDTVVLEAVWAAALLSYARCFGEADGSLTVQDVASVQPEQDLSGWHQVLLDLRDHYADPAQNPRERFTIGVAQDADGRASGVAVTSVVQPMVDLATVRQAGAIAYALRAQVDARIEEQQRTVNESLARLTVDQLEQFPRITLVSPDAPTT